MFTVDEVTRQRFYDLAKLVADVDGELTPEIVAVSTDLDFEHGLILHPSPLRSIGFYVAGDLWMYRYIDHNVIDGTVYHVGEPQALAPVGHPELAEVVARMLARAGREIVSSIADKIIVPRETVADVFESHIAGAARMAFSARAWLTRNGYASEW